MCCCFIFSIYSLYLRHTMALLQFFLSITLGSSLSFFFVFLNSLVSHMDVHVRKCLTTWRQQLTINFDEYACVCVCVYVCKKGVLTFGIFFNIINIFFVFIFCSLVLVVINTDEIRALKRVKVCLIVFLTIYSLVSWVKIHKFC